MSKIELFGRALLVIVLAMGWKFAPGWWSTGFGFLFGFVLYLQLSAAAKHRDV